MRTLAAGIALTALGAATALAEDAGVKALPTLLIKGEVVSLDTSDSAAMLLKVKDRYGFETPIFVTPETKVSQADQTLSSSSLQAGAQVEVEYSFDINTAKRYAVAVKLPAAAEATTPSAQAPTAAEPASVPEAVPAPETSVGPTTQTAPTPAAPTEAPSAPAQ
jgi:hypothetical protein